MVSETIGFTTLRATRPITVDIVGDANSNALLEIEAGDREAIDGRTFTDEVTIEITNHTGKTLDEGTSGDLVVDIAAIEADGDELSIESDDFDSNNAETGSKSKDITGDNDSVKLTLSRSLEPNKSVQFSLNTDVTNNSGFVKVGITFTAEFAGETLRAPDRTVKIDDN